MFSIINIKKIVVDCIFYRLNSVNEPENVIA